MTPPGIVLIEGPLGIGKTALVQALLRRAGVGGPVKSPTFDLVHPHQGPRGRYLHVDLYRLEAPPPPEELDVDADEALVLVEWGGPWAPYFPDHVAACIAKTDRGRRLTLQGVGTWAARVRAWADGSRGGSST